MNAIAVGEAEAFLAALADPARPQLPFRTAIVVAHPDDETIGCGAQLPRFSDIRVIHVTDGAPRNGADAAQLGFAGPADYAAARRRELQAPMALAGISPERLVALGWPDQEASLHLAEIATELARRLSGCELALTHAYEGGHPDHDATAFAVHAACALLRRRGSAPAIIEMPLYRSGGSEWAVQSFVPEPEIAVAIAQLGPEERRLKQVMLAAFASQAHVLARFSLTEEPFRRAPRYDFRQLPNGGQLLYEQQQWGMTGARWRELAAAALAALDLQPSP